MSLSDELRKGVEPLWERIVTHPFVMELGDGTLPPEKFQVYFQQDYLFLKDWIALMCGGVSKAPDFALARPSAAFVHTALQGEEGLFQRYFREVGVSQEEVRNLQYLPTSMAYSGFLRGIARDGTFLEIITTLLGIEWPYLDWAQRLTSAGNRPPNSYYQTWIDIHAGKELEDFVGWLRRVLDETTVPDRARLQEHFLTTMRYEYLFWEMAYKGEQWPD